VITDDTRRLLKEAALRNGLGGNRYSHRKVFTDAEIQQLYEKYISSGNRLESLFSDKLCKTDKAWLNDLSRHMDKESRLRFTVLLRDRCCNACNIKIGLSNLTRSSATIGTYCKSCTDKRVWARSEHIGDDKLKQRGKKITNAKLAHYSSDKGDITKTIIGAKNSIKMKAWYSTAAGLEQIERSRVRNSKIMKDKIRNGEFTPRITNTWTHWTATAIVNGKSHKFRSSWEACFWICNQHLSYETLRIPYEKNGEQHTYIADFHDIITNTLYEIKPRSSFNDQIDKMTCIINHCIKVGIKFVWINEDNIWQWIDESMIDEVNKPQLDKLKGIRRAKASD